VELGSGTGDWALAQARGAPETLWVCIEQRSPPPPPRTKWTRRVPHPVLIGHAASLSQVCIEQRVDRALRCWAAARLRGAENVLTVCADAGDFLPCLPAGSVARVVARSPRPAAALLRLRARVQPARRRRAAPGAGLVVRTGLAAQ